ncbi:two-component system LytT family response regulator [Aquimarina sp. EL_43]|uniref:LytR/AlgR family response regulator transcription factor n=1 Tax=Aquimarina TaxID=290174 RepID=UPI0004711F11|nr:MULTISPECIES: LytTR family DNA-binding domain-containing protein [Aquimarina]MBG6133251.1 two-component system LytT family response regulator [Aquimarina sp. EL_35]MBG6153390.1 two-component system LytT family response regulator [Aquimarina sp. EL_32]MBG6171565.1 two-component system LytT family response regulator [Aquimarina sp. EL_43]
MRLRYMIIDDEYLARQRLIKLLENFEDITLVGECRNGNEAIEKITLKEPDLIFLDIQMPDMNGFNVISRLQHKPYVIFTTAYDTYALKAFEINAVDYLLKPFDEERLHVTLDRVFELKKRKKASNLEDKIKKLISNYESKSSDFLNEIIIHEKGRDVVIRIDDIIYFKSDGNYVQIIMQDKRYLHRITMNALFDSLDTFQFLRIHRSLIVNKIYIKSCKYTSNNEYLLKLKNNEELISSRSYKPSISDYLSSLET